MSRLQKNLTLSSRDICCPRGNEKNNVTTRKTNGKTNIGDRESRNSGKSKSSREPGGHGAGKRSHHHGDLRAALIDAGVDLVSEHGASALSIRKVAARAGVSHAAPAHHFATLADLRTAVIARGHLKFAAMMREQIELADASDPRAMLLAACRGYMNFAFQNPSMFHLMFGGFEKSADDMEFSRAAEASYEILREVSAPLLPGRAGPEGNEILVWSIIHGYVGIMLNDNSALKDHADRAALLEMIFPDLPMREPG